MAYTYLLHGASKPFLKKILSHRMSPLLTKTARILSYVFSPILISTYCTAFALWMSSTNTAPTIVLLKVTGVIFIATAAVPSIIILILYKLGVVSDTNVTVRSERFIPMSVAVICFIFCAWYLHTVRAPEWMVNYYLGAALAAIIALILTSIWKISIHGMGAGCICSLMLAMALGGYTQYFMLPWIIVAFVLAGILCTCRLIIDAHTPAQVYAGFALAFTITFISALLPW